MADNQFWRSGWMLASATALGLSLVAAGCAGSDDEGDENEGGTSPTPTPEAEFKGTIEFVGVPQDGTPIALNYQGLTTDINFETDNFSLAEPGSCASNSACGYVEFKIDGDDGNLEGKSYNALDSQAPVHADFSVLDNPLGNHTITAELILNDGTPTGVVATASVVTELPLPAIAITSPTRNESQFLLPDDNIVNIGFTITNMALKAPGTCGDTYTCGHIYVKIDGDAGNQDGSPYNNIVSTGVIGEQNSVDVLLDYLDVPTGEHEIVLSFREDDGSAFTTSEGLPVEARITVTITSPTDPQITILNLEPNVDTNNDGEADATQVQAEDDGYRSFAVEFDVANFTLSNNCGSTANCGHVVVLLDAEGGQASQADLTLGNAPGEDFNNDGPYAVQGDHYTIDAHFHWLEYNANDLSGVHAVTLMLVDDDGDPIVASDVHVTDTGSAQVQANEDVLFMTISNPNTSTQQVPHANDDEKSVNISYTINVPSSLNPQWVLPTDACPGNTAKNCLHLRVYIDDDAGNKSSSEPYNNLGIPPAVGAGAPQIDAIFGELDESDLYEVEHHVVVAIYDHDGLPYLIANDDGTSVTTAAGSKFEVVANQQGNN